MEKVWLTLNAEKNEENRFILHLVNLDYYHNYVIGRRRGNNFSDKIVKIGKRPLLLTFDLGHTARRVIFAKLKPSVMLLISPAFNIQVIVLTSLQFTNSFTEH